MARWRGSVVRMKRSLLIPQRRHRSRYSPLMASQWAWGVRPDASAERWIFSPCSSQPVMKVTVSPCNRRKRAMLSQARVV